MGHADPRTTRAYGRSRHNLDRHPTYTMIEVQGNLSALLGELLEPRGATRAAGSDDRADRRRARAGDRRPPRVPGVGCRAGDDLPPPPPPSSPGIAAPA